MGITSSSFGKTGEGKEAMLYQLKNVNGMEIKVTDFGAAVVSVKVPDKDGVLRDVVLGYDNAAGYENGSAFLGACVGRSANRIGGAAFSLNGEEYQLEKNERGNNLHSGPNCFHTRIWDVEEQTENSITFSLFSPHLDQGYPANVKICVTYTLTDNNEVEIHYHAVPDGDTILNMTNHSYFNLDGHDAGSVLEQTLWMDADEVTEVDAELISTGRKLDVTGTPMDFRQEKKIGKDIDAEDPQLKLGGGYDHNWVLNGTGYRKVAAAASEKSGISMEVWTDCPGIQYYAANGLGEVQGKEDIVYHSRDGFCLETQFFPDSIHHPEFESPVCKAGETYDSKTTYHFIVK